jgi:hypothetical protein
MTVHLFVLNNVSEESDACTYIQPLLLRNNGRRDVLALREQYENEATIQTRVNIGVLDYARIPQSVAPCNYFRVDNLYQLLI